MNVVKTGALSACDVSFTASSVAIDCGGISGGIGAADLVIVTPIFAIVVTE